jgi:hypothetical protein
MMQHVPSTKAMDHPHWDAIRDALALRFKHSEELEKWAVDVVSAHLMECPDRMRRSLQMLGPDAAGDVINICKGYCIDISLAS